MKVKFFKEKNLIWGVNKWLFHAMFLLFFLVVFLILTPINHLDFYTHNKQLLTFYDTNYWRPNFLYYLLVAIVSGFSRDMMLLAKVAACFMAFAIYAKWIVTEKLSKLLFSKENYNVIWRQLPFFLLFVFSLPASYNNWYFGQISPNQWHNSTTILLMPFAILLFYHTYRFYVEEVTKSKWPVIWLSVLNVLIKPSFLFCLFPVVFLFTVLMHPPKKWFQKLWLLLPAILLLSGQYLILFIPNFKSAAVLSGEDGGVAFSVFHVWQHYSDNIILSFLLSVAFPLVVYVYLGKSLLRNKLYIFTVAVFVVAVLIFTFLTETGRRQFHCNFIWQAIVANYLLYWISAEIFLMKTLRKVSGDSLSFWAIISSYFVNKQYKAIAVYLLFLLQCLGGFYYLLRMVVRNGSYG